MHQHSLTSMPWPTISSSFTWDEGFNVLGVDEEGGGLDVMGVAR